jgi:hypothetical protein
MAVAWRAALADVQDARMPRRPGMAVSGLDPIGKFAKQAVPGLQPSLMCRMHECLEGQG